MTAYSVATNVVSATITGPTTASPTFSYTPVKVGNLGFFGIAWQASTQVLNSVSSSNATWSTLRPKFTGSVGSNTYAFQIMAAIPTSTSAQTVTLSFGAALTGIQVDYMEFTADWLGKNPANWIFADTTPVFGSSSATVNWPSLTGFAIDEMFLGYCFPGGAVTCTNGTPAGFVYNNGAANGNPFAWHLTYGKGPSIPTGSQSPSATYMAYSTVFCLHTSWIPASVNGNVT